jgi:hypothetical protein
MYFQLVQSDVYVYASASVCVLSGRKNRTLAKCTETAGYHTITEAVTSAVKKEETYRTCYLGILARLEAGDFIYLLLNTPGKPIETYFRPDTAFFGLLKFT